jgi:hypothetical protein
MPTRLDIAGERFGRLLVLRFAHMKNSTQHWYCLCDCGTEKIVSGSHLIADTTRSCGCLRKERMSEAHTVHGMHRSPEYRCWNQIISRCTNSKVKAYKNYGARGISVCNRRRYGEDGKSGAACFLQDILAEIGSRQSPRHSIDRANNDGNYEPGNMKWSSCWGGSSNCKQRLV